MTVAALEGNGAVAGVRLGDDSIVPAEIAVIGIGILPNVEIAEAAGLAVDNGIVVERRADGPRTRISTLPAMSPTSPTPLPAGG